VLLKRLIDAKTGNFLVTVHICRMYGSKLLCQVSGKLIDCCLRY